ncbi:hypothetical protein [Novosphingobium sp.]|uniref:hypothetical protein n=1 Tax=Novosphingobium sp. TaxID=1874826 RepID=UPI0025EA4D0E|nr:hypothetical protein [Novosphingobium sp.]
MPGLTITITKGQRDDRIAIARADGSTAQTCFPHKGPVPHDAVHFFTERGLALPHAFWGLIGQGRHPEELAELAKAQGHASAKRAQVPGADIVQLLQAERLVECFEAQLWAHAAPDAAFMDVARVACELSHVPLPPISLDQCGAVMAEIFDFAKSWMAAPVGHAATLEWN